MTALHQLLNISKQTVCLDSKAICLCQSMYKGGGNNAVTYIIEKFEIWQKTVHEESLNI